MPKQVLNSKYMSFLLHLTPFASSWLAWGLQMRQMGLSQFPSVLKLRPDISLFFFYFTPGVSKLSDMTSPFF